MTQPNFFFFHLGNQEETYEVHHYSGALNDEEEEENETVHQRYCSMEAEGGPGSFEGVNNTEITQNEQVIT